MLRIEIIILLLIYLTDMVWLVPKYTRCKYDHTPRGRKLVWKGLCVGVALLTLIIGTVMAWLLGEGTVEMLLLSAGMLLCAVGDIVLEIRFVKGGFLFFSGHLLYVIAVIVMSSGFSWLSPVVFAVLVTVGTVLTVKLLGKKHLFLLIGYNVMISASFSLSLALVFSGKPAAVLAGMGICCLGISDWLLARNKAMGSTFGWSLLSLIFYFGGQLMISAYPWIL